MASYGHTTEVSDFDDKGNVKRSGNGNIATFWLEDRVGPEDTIIQREMVTIRAPGDRLSEWSGKVTEDIRRTYPREYEAFKRGAEMRADGTPIQSWTEVSISARREMMLLGFDTIEQLANATDAQCMGITHGNVWRKKAQIHVEKNRKTVDVVAENEALKAQLAAIAARMEKLEAGNVLHQPGQGDDQPRAKRKYTRKAGDETGSGDTAS